MPPRSQIAPELILAVGPGGRCPSCLGVVVRICLEGEDGVDRWMPADRVGDAFEVHDCQPRGWYPGPASQKVA
jgi:hypothetical protein